MTTELEEQFFKTFKICKKCSDKKYEKCMGICYDCKYFKYPEITDRVLLELVCILSRYNMGMFNHVGTITIKPYEIYVCNIKELKEKVLQDVIIKMQELKNVEWQSLFKHQIQQLFKEGE
ncbi:hypothetical protein IKE67_08890 [bacterium]|nr:hypothetical protein [bacterium]